MFISRECILDNEANGNVKSNFIVKRRTERAKQKCEILTRKNKNATFTESVGLLPSLFTL